MRINPKFISDSMSTDDERIQEIEALNQSLQTSIDNLQTQIDALSGGGDPQVISDIQNELLAIQNKLIAIQSSTGLESDDSYLADATSDYISGAVSLKDADSLLDDQVKVNADSISQEMVDRASADAALQGNINQETVARQAADTVLQENLDQEALARQSADTALQDSIVAETVARVDADATLQDSIDTEKLRIDEMLSGSELDKNSFAEIVELIKDIDAENDNAFISYILNNDAQIEQEITTRADADALLQSNIDQEASTRTNVDTILQSNIDAEAVARADADTALQSSIDAELVARADADELLQSNIDAESAARESSDTLLQNNIDAEAVARADADTALQSNIDTEANVRESSDTLLQNNIDAEAVARADADTNLDSIKLNKAGDTMTGNLDLGNNDIDNINKITEKSIVTTPTYTTVTQDGTLTLTSASTSVHFLTGTASNFSVVFPDATTLQQGQNYEIYNRSSSPVTLKYPDGTIIGILSVESVSSLILQENADTNGMYSPFSVEVNQASGISNYSASSVTPFATSSTNAFEDISDFVVVPAPGKYAVWFNCSATSTNNNADNFVVLKRGTTEIIESERTSENVASNFIFQLQTLAVIDFDGTQELRAAVKVTTGTLTINARTGVAIRLGPAG